MRHRGRRDLVVRPAALEGRGVVEVIVAVRVLPPHAADPDAIRATAARAQVDREAQRLGVGVEHDAPVRCRRLQVAHIFLVVVGAAVAHGALGHEHERVPPLVVVDAVAKAGGVDVERDRALTRRQDLKVSPLLLEQVAVLRVGRRELLGRLGHEQRGVHERRAAFGHGERDEPSLVLALLALLWQLVRKRAGRALDHAEAHGNLALPVQRAARQDERQRTLPLKKGFCRDRRGVPQLIHESGRAARRPVAVDLRHHDQAERVARHRPCRLRHQRLHVEAVDGFFLDLQDDVAAALHRDITRLAGHHRNRARAQRELELAAGGPEQRAARSLDADVQRLRRGLHLCRAVLGRVDRARHHKPLLRLPPCGQDGIRHCSIVGRVLPLGVGARHVAQVQLDRRLLGDAACLLDLVDGHGEQDSELVGGAHAPHDEVAPVTGVGRELDLGLLRLAREVDDRRGALGLRFLLPSPPGETAVLVVDGQPVRHEGARAADPRGDRHEPVALEAARAPTQPVMPLEGPLGGALHPAAGRAGIGERRVWPSRTCNSVGVQAARLHR